MWEIRNEGHAWRSGEAMDRYMLAPNKIEMVDGRQFDTDEERETLLCLLLENVGADRTVQLGDPAVWKAAIAKLEMQSN
jgi:hypothetical protein